MRARATCLRARGMSTSRATRSTPLSPSTGACPRTPGCSQLTLTLTLTLTLSLTLTLALTLTRFLPAYSGLQPGDITAERFAEAIFAGASHHSGQIYPYPYPTPTLNP